MRAIYIIDEMAGDRIWLHRLLTRNPNLIVRSFSSGESFLAVAHELDPGVALVDLRMAGTDGMAVLHAIQNNRLLLPIALTSHGSIAMAVQAMKEGAVDFIEKPYTVELLLEVIEAAFIQLEFDSLAMVRVTAAKAKICKLSPRERDVMNGLIAGSANKIIAHQLGISPRTIEIYRANLMDKLEVHTLSEALRIAFDAGLIGEFDRILALRSPTPVAKQASAIR